jgi:hypothetical protein
VIGTDIAFADHSVWIEQLPRKQAFKFYWDRNTGYRQHVMNPGKMIFNIQNLVEIGFEIVHDKVT